MAFWDNILFKFFEKIQKTIFGPIGDTLREQATSDNGWTGFFKNVGTGNYLSSALNTLTGAHLNGAQIEANEFTRQERLEAQEWTAQREDTAYQRQVADMKAAGLNPMMAAGGSPSTASSSGGQSVSPHANFGLGDLMSLMLMPAQYDVLKSQANKNNAQADESGAKVVFWDMSAEKALEQVNLLREQVKTEGSKSEFYLARGTLANVTADNIKYLQEANKQYLEAMANAANTASEANSARAAADYIHALYEAKLIESDYIASLCKKVAADTAAAYASAGASSAQANAYNHQAALFDLQGQKVTAETYGQEIANKLQDGTYTKDVLENGSFWDKMIIQTGRVTDALNFNFGVTIGNK